MTPLESDLVLVQCLRLQDEVVEEGCYQPYGTYNHVVRRLLLLRQTVEEGGEIGSVFAQIPIVMKIRSSLHRRGQARVVKVVRTKAMELISKELRHSCASLPDHHSVPERHVAGHDEAIIFGHLQAQREPISAAIKRDANLHCACDTRPEVQNSIGAPGPLDILIGRVVSLGLQQRERADEVRLARAVRADQDVDWTERKVSDASDALEALDADRRDLRMMWVVLVQRLPHLGLSALHVGTCPRGCSSRSCRPDASTQPAVSVQRRLNTA